MRHILCAVFLLFFLSCSVKETAPIIEILPEEEEIVHERIDTVDVVVFSETPVVEIKFEETEEVITQREDVEKLYQFSIQIGAFFIYKNANKRRQEAAKLLSGEVFIEIVGKYYKVRVGRFNKKWEAENKIEGIRKVYPDAFIADLK
ncbi:SPOR domain-containing protein [candidate division WOR-3 bacterium]|nr:SPOR domain-containing protein [candidate division WOR-3 bacterium]